MSSVIHASSAGWKVSTLVKWLSCKEAQRTNGRINQAGTEKEVGMMEEGDALSVGGGC
jgi:hypothetical protein